MTHPMTQAMCVIVHICLRHIYSLTYLCVKTMTYVCMLSDAPQELFLTDHVHASDEP